MGRLRIAVPTGAHAGLEDIVSEVFGRAKTFTIVDVEDGEIRNVQVLDNPSASSEYGSGPIAVKTLADNEVDLVLVGQLGPGASNLLQNYNIKKSSVKPNTKVVDSIKQTMAEIESKRIRKT